jgi:hypothetical protein
MATSRRGRPCPDLLSFEEVRRRLGLGTRLTVGRREVRIADIVGSVGRVEDFDGCFRPKNARLRTMIRERAANPAVRDLPIRLIAVDHAYFVEDGHKRLSLAIADGRQEVDADVDQFETPYHLAPGATMDSIRVTARERRFLDTTGLARAVPSERFPLSDPDGYLELEESVKAHTLDLSQATGRLLSPEEGARHWFEAVYTQVLEIADASSASRLLESTTGPDRYLLFRKGFDAAMDLDWRSRRASWSAAGRTWPVGRRRRGRASSRPSAAARAARRSCRRRWTTRTAPSPRSAPARRRRVA